MANNEISNVNFKGLIENNEHANWLAAREIYAKGDPTLPTLGHKHTRFFHWSQRLCYAKVYQSIFVVSTQTYMQGLQGRKIIDEAKTRYHIIHGGCYWVLPQEKAL